MKDTKRSFLTSCISLLLCFVMLLGTTFAWFTDEVTSANNIIQAGNLDIELQWSKDNVIWHNAGGINDKPIFDYDRWEPGYTEVRYLKVKNEGSLAFKYQMSINPVGPVGTLAEVIDVNYDIVTGNNSFAAPTKDNKQGSLKKVGTLDDLINANGIVVGGVLLPEGESAAGYYSEEIVVCVTFHMDENAGNEYQNLSIGEGFGIKLMATQFDYENDSFDNGYDDNATWPEIPSVGNNASADVQTDTNGVLLSDTIINGNGMQAEIPAGVQLTQGTNKLTLSVKDVENSEANVTLADGEELRALDVHISGVADGNTTPIAVTLTEALPKGLNMGNYTLHHVEDGATVSMTALADGETPAHNTFAYDPATGDVTLYLASFSEFALVAAPAVWEGNFDYSWYTNAVAPADGEAVTEYVIANADQLAALSAIVGGMNGQTQDSFAGKTVKLLADINLGDKESENNSDLIFYPIGYWNNEGTYERLPAEQRETAVESGFYSFSGTFDGNGHTISNFYQNTWEMKGDHNWYDPIKEQYYRDGMGLFGRVYKGTVKNLTVNNFSSDGEIATTGVIAAYADGATFENIAIFNCNPRVYNIGNGGIVGCVGWYAKEADLKTTFKNITVDNSNKISALWGSYDVPCGGIVGQYYVTSGQTSANKPANGGLHFENCHISAQLDVNNDVCANYQYYAYRYAGMLIGSVSENETIDGHVYPNMTGITATGCTVHFGTWNDYYYCEIIDNTTASYTHDYQMSRLTEIKAIDGTTITYLDGTTGTVPASGRANYVIVDYTKGHGTENATCYHFKDGKVWNHSDAGTEIVNGTEVLVEDKQHLYLEFNNLVTGYGWGVTTKGVGDLAGVTILDRETGDSVQKFESSVTELTTDRTYTINEIFAYIESCGVKVVDAALSVTITNLDENGNVIATFKRDSENWENGTISFENTGNIAITIQDYYFCNETTINVTITDRQPEVKFDVVMNNGDFLHRVGNDGTVAIDKLFKAKDGVTVGTVSVTVEAVNGTSASGTYSNNAIQFNGTGVVKVTITDNDYCIPTELYLEVVDATNITSATGTTSGGNFVLLCDVNTTTYVNYWNCTIYGNGFTYSLKGAPTAYNSKQGKGILITKNAVLDNLVIDGDVYNGYGAFTNNDYYNTAIDVTGDTIIQNCYISGCSAPVRARNNVTIINTTLYGGAVGNLIIESGTVTLEDVTTANYDDGRSLVGMGIVIHSDATEEAKLVLNGKLTQYNFMSESKVPTDSYAKNLHSTMFGSNCSKYHFGTSPNRYVNTGIVSLTNVFNADDITDNAKTGYVGTAVTVNSVNGYVYTQLSTSGSVNNNCPEYKPTTQGAVPPSYSFDYTNKNYQAKQDGSNDYCYEENGKVNISMDKGDTFNWDTSILTIGKGITNYTVSMDGVDYTGKSIAFNTAGDYTVTYAYTDGNNYKFDENGNITTYSVTYTKTVNITVAVVEAATKHAEFTFGSSNTASTTVTVGNNTYVMPNVSGTSSTIGSTTVNGQTIYYPIVEIVMSDGKTTHSSGWYAYFPVFSGAVTITDYADNGNGDKMTPYNGSTTTMPSGLSVVGDPKTLFKYQSGSNANSSTSVKNNILVYSSAKIEANREEYNTVVQYSYTDNAGTTYYYYIGYHAPAQKYSPSCVTPDTLVTLADGSQVRIDSLTGDEMLLVWNHQTGAFESVPVAYIVNHNNEKTENEIIHLYFSDGNEIKIIGEHVFFDATLNKYVSITSANAEEYIGHLFTGINSTNDALTAVELIKVERYVEETEIYEIVSYQHLTCFSNNILSTSAYLDKLLNIFDINPDTMAYSAELVQKDIETYGLYTYADFEDLISEEAFELYNAAYLKIAVGKGYITWDDILDLIDIYFAVDVQPIQ